MRLRPLFTLVALCAILFSSGCCCHRGCWRHRCCGGCGGCGGCSSCCCGYTPPGEVLPPPAGIPHGLIPPGAVAVPPPLGHP